MPGHRQDSLRAYAQPAFFYFAFAVWLANVFFHATVTDDAYITFRVVNNIVNGYGLRYNIDERVQAYSNPLWMLLHVPFFALWRNIDMITLLLSCTCAAATALVIRRTFALPAWIFALAFFLPLCLSKTLTYYFTSGLENPLTHLLFACFGYALLRLQGERRWFYMSLYVALSMVNRLDTIIAYLPILAYVALQNRKNLPLKPILLGALPIVAWLCFSFFYYGFIFPNTRYAKLALRIPLSEYLEHGTAYVEDFALSDPVMAYVIMLTAGACIWRIANTPRANLEIPMIGLGMFAYVSYVINVGGSYISCLFLSLPCIMSLWLVLAFLPSWKNHAIILAAPALMVALFWLSLLPETQDQLTLIRQDDHVHGMNTGYRFFKNDSFWPKPELLTQQLPATDCPTSLSEQYPIVISIHRGDFFLAPCIHQIDINALSEPLLARLPPARHKIVLVGHLIRDLPKNYIESLETGNASLLAEDLRGYYEPLRLIVSGDVWNAERLKTIILFNLGAYDDYRDAYISHIR